MATRNERLEDLRGDLAKLVRQLQASLRAAEAMQETLAALEAEESEEEEVAPPVPSARPKSSRPSGAGGFQRPPGMRC